MNGEPRQLYELLYRGGWTLLGFSGRGKHADPVGADNALDELATDVPRYLVSFPTGESHNTPTLWDLDGEAHRVYGVAKLQLVLIRPDGHIAVRAPLAARATVADYLRRWNVSGQRRFSGIPEAASATRDS